MKKRFSNWLNKDTGSGGNGSGSSGGHGSQGTTRSPSQTPMPLSIPTNYISAPTSASLHSISSSAPSPNERSSRPTVSGNASNSGRSGSRSPRPPMPAIPFPVSSAEGSSYPLLSSSASSSNSFLASSSPSSSKDWSSAPPESESSRFEITVVSAVGLYLSSLRLPDPIAVLTVDGEQQMTAVLRETSMPVWNQTFQMEMKRSSTLVIQIFDEPNRTSRNDQALLGSLVVRISTLYDFVVTGRCDLTIAQDLKHPQNEDLPAGKVTLQISSIASGKLFGSPSVITTPPTAPLPEGHILLPKATQPERALEPLRSLKLTVLSAGDLAIPDSIAKPTPFALVTVGEDQYFSDAVKNTRNPSWSNTFEIKARKGTLVVVQVHDEPSWQKVADHSFLGSALFRLDDVLDSANGEAKLYNYQLLDANREPTGGTLSVAVKTDGSVVDDKRERKSSILLPNAGDILSQAGKIFEFKVSNLDHFVKPADRAPVRSDSTSFRSLPSFVDEPSSPGSAAQVASFAYEDEIGPLPPGWEYRVDSAGRGYYVDHNSRKTTRERPPLGASGAGAPVAPTPPASPKLAPSASSRGGPSGQSRGGSNNVPVLPSTPTSVDSNSPSNQLRSGHTVVTSIISNSQNEHVDSSILEYLYAEAARRDEKYGPLPDGWELRITTKRNLVFVNHQTQTTTWNDPRLPTIASNNGVPVASAEFKERFKQKVSKFRALADLKPNSGQTLINVRRAAIFEDGRTLIMSKSPFDLRKKLNVKFAGEEGLDYGGLSREFFFCLSNEIFNPRNGLFEYTNPDSYTFQINAESGRIRTNHLMYFTFVGRVVGLAIFHNHLIPAHFTTVFYKTLLRRPITVSDLASVDPEMHRSLQWILSNPLGIGDTDDDGLLDGMTFTADETQQGVFRTVELCPGGASRRVTEENKAEYVRLLAQHRIVGKVREQFAAFERGLFEILPRDSLEAFDERELEVLLGGMSEIDLSDWKRFTTYKGYSGESDPVIQRFWRVIESWDNDKRARLLQFVTGTSRVPLSGFKELRGSDGPRLFCIERTGSPRSLPTSHTCFNRLDLPPYETMDILDSKLSLSITETAGFGQQ